MGVVGVDDEALFMHPPVAAQWETAGLSGPSFKMLIVSCSWSEAETHNAHSLWTAVLGRRQAFICVRQTSSGGPGRAYRLRVRVSRTEEVSEVSLVPCFCAKVLLISGAACLPHL